jgi:hypothetical protein
MFNTLIRDARTRGFSLLDANLEWSWPTLHLDNIQDYRNVLWYYTRVLAASRLQTVLRRKLLALAGGSPWFHSNSNEDDYDFINSCIADEEWQIVLGFSCDD